MANVKFLRGNQSGLPSGASIIDGALYVTLDTKRLFMGYDDAGTKSLIPIAEGITTVTSVSVLPAAAQHEGEFYYITDGNVLAWSNGTTWLQTNTDTHLVAKNNVLSVNNGVVSFSAEDSSGNALSGNFTVAAGTNNVTIGQGANGELTISVAEPITYELKSEGGASNNTNDDIAIVLDPSSGADQKVAFKNSTSVDVIRDQSTGAISFAVNQGGISGVASAHVFPYTKNDTTYPASSNNGFELKLVTGDGTELGNIFDPTIVYGNSGNQTAHFANGVATLSVPTSSELTAAINNLEKTINAMTYRGVASSAAVITDSPLHNGDVWLANDEFSVGGKAVKPGYLIVVQGTETDGVIPSASATYDVVKGNDTDTTYKGVATTHGLQLTDQDDGVAAEIALTAGTSIELTDTASQKSNSIEVKHADVTRTDPAKSAEQQQAGVNLSFDVVTGVTTNAQGHVTGVATKTITVVDTQLDAGTWATNASVTNNVATVSHTNNGSLGEINMSLGSVGETIAVTASGSNVNLDIVWGTFGSN